MASGRSQMPSILTVCGQSIPSSLATDSVRSLSLAIRSAASGASASRVPSAASSARRGISAAMPASAVGRMTRVG